MKNKQFYRLEKQVAAGKWNFILKRGVLGWGIPMGIFTTLSAYYFRGLHQEIPTVISNVLFWAIMGFPFGYIMWQMTTSRYFNEKKDRGLKENKIAEEE